MNTEESPQANVDRVYRSILTYEATSDDFAEPGIRQYLRTATARSAQVKSTVIGVLLMAAVCAWSARHQSPAVLASVAALGGLGGGLLNHALFASGVRRRVKKHMERELQGQVPARVTYAVTGDELSCDTLNTKLTFQLADLTTISEDASCVEIIFGPKGLCTIPLRAFTTPQEKADFIMRLRGG